MRPIPVALVLVPFLFVFQAHAKTIKVPGGQPTIAAAVAAAADGDIIQLSKGRYQEAINTTKSLKFIGGKGVIWDGFFGGSFKDQLVATAAGVIVRDITFVNSDDALRIVGDDAKVEGCRFESCFNAVFIDGARARVQNNRIVGSQGGGLAIEVDGPDAIVLDNDLLYNEASIIRVDAESAGSARVERNVLDSSSERMALEVLNAAAPKIRKNRLQFGSGDGTCILALNCSAAEVSGNKVSNLNQNVIAGILVIGSSAKLRKNVLENLNGNLEALTCIQVVGDQARIEKNKFRNCAGAQSNDTSAVQASGNGHRIHGNRVSDLGGGGATSFGIHVLGDDGSVTNNRIERLIDASTNGIIVTGERAEVDRNDLRNLGSSFALLVTGDDFRVTDNSVRQCAAGSLPIGVNGSGTTLGDALVRGNEVSNIGSYAFDIAGSRIEFRDNEVKNVAHLGFYVGGDDHLLVNNEVRDCQDDGFVISGNDNVLKNCRVKNAGRDGFDVNDSGNTLIQCQALDCKAEGLDNGGTNTTATNCVFKKSRIDYAGNNNMASDAGTKFTTGGPGTAPEID